MRRKGKHNTALVKEHSLHRNVSRQQPDGLMRLTSELASGAVPPLLSNWLFFSHQHRYLRHLPLFHEVERRGKRGAEGEWGCPTDTYAQRGREKRLPTSICPSFPSPTPSFFPNAAGPSPLIRLRYSVRALCAWCVRHLARHTPSSFPLPRTQSLRHLASAVPTSSPPPTSIHLSTKQIKRTAQAAHWDGRGDETNYPTTTALLISLLPIVLQSVFQRLSRQVECGLCTHYSPAPLLRVLYSARQLFDSLATYLTSHYAITAATGI